MVAEAAVKPLPPGKLTKTVYGLSAASSCWRDTTQVITPLRQHAVIVAHRKQGTGVPEASVTLHEA